MSYSKSIEYIPGIILPWAGGTTPPEGWIYCNGSVFSTVKYRALYNTIGQNFGSILQYSDFAGKEPSKGSGSGLSFSSTDPIMDDRSMYIAHTAEQNNITFADSNDFYFGTDDFTVDFWIKADGAGLISGPIVGQYQDSNNYWYVWGNAPSQSISFKFVYGGVTKAEYDVVNDAISNSTWQHISFSRTGSTAVCLIDGSLVSWNPGSTEFGSNDVGDISSVLTIGEVLGLSQISAKIAEVRISKGIARWTSSFTPQSSHYGIDDYTVLLLQFGSSIGFRVPDLRGIHIRGWDSIGGTPSGIDPDAASRSAYCGGCSGNNIGSYQLDAYKSHTHNYCYSKGYGDNVWWKRHSNGNINADVPNGGTSPGHSTESEGRINDTSVDNVSTYWIIKI